MANACEVMMEENDIELSLGLSLGGCFKKSEKSLGIRQKSVPSSAVDEKSGETEAYLKSSVSPISGELWGEKKEVEIEGEVLDPGRKRKIQALRRQEAKKKRDEKQRMRTSSMDKKMLLEAHQSNRSEEIYKKPRVTYEEDQQDASKQSQSSNLSSGFVPVSVQHPFPQLQYIPFGNGFPIPYALPYWAAPPPASASVDDEKNIFQLFACTAFRPFQAQNSNVNQNRSGSCDSEQKGSKDGGAKYLESSLCSSGSLGSGSSVISDYQSTSYQGGCSNDTRSYSSRSASEEPRHHSMVVSNARRQTERSVSSQPTEPSQGIEETEQEAEKLVSSSPSQTNPEKTEGKPITTTDNPPPRSPTRVPQRPREAKVEANKPPKPPKHQPHKTKALPYMPCVSTTGNGPNGKTITGFLSSYTKTEISIECVCHGSSFTPAEFVKHAGGTDISHPLKHIVVVPTTF